MKVRLGLKYKVFVGDKEEQRAGQREFESQRWKIEDIERIWIKKEKNKKKRKV